MACQCGKNRKRKAPTGSTPTGQQNPITQAKQPKSTSSSSEKLAKRASTYVLRTVSGSTMTFGSRLEAQAAAKRSGGGTIIAK